ncbi:MAG: LysM peptidoglycan-binding domain-containing protein [Terriglobia bacterium]
MDFRPQRRVELRGGLLICVLCLCAAPGFAQSLGEIARQERARKQSQPARPSHVYTNEDMTRPQILLPEDQTRFQATREETKPTLAQPADKIPVISPWLDEIPLGDVARHYRLQKQLQQGQQLSDLPGLGSATPLAAPIISKPPSVPVPTPAADPLKRSSLRGLTATEGRAIEGAGGVRVARGDSLWKLAKRHLGSGMKWRQLAALNPQLTDLQIIRVGEWIRLPLAPSASQMAKMVRVHKGDTLWKLARVELGTGLAWECIAEANPHLQNVNLIYPGQPLAIPARCVPAP